MMSSDDGRDEVDQLKASRRGFKAALTKTGRAVEAEIIAHGANEDPVALETRLDGWAQKLAKYLDAEDAVNCHMDAANADADEDSETHEYAYAQAKMHIVTFRHN